MTRQVRLDDDVAEELAGSAERSGRSLTAEANVRLRAALGADVQTAGRRDATPSGDAVRGTGQSETTEGDGHVPAPARAIGFDRRRRIARTRVR